MKVEIMMMKMKTIPKTRVRVRFNLYKLIIKIIYLVFILDFKEGEGSEGESDEAGSDVGAGGDDDESKEVGDDDDDEEDASRD